MTRTTVTQIAKAMGGRLWTNGGTFSIYEFPSDSKTLHFREKVPFLTVWGGQNSMDPNGCALTVHFDEVTS